MTDAGVGAALLRAHKEAAKAAREAGSPIPEHVLRGMSVEASAKITEARRTRRAPSAGHPPVEAKAS